MPVLYRKYRPQSFKDIYGQEHVTKTLINALKGGQIGHAYLFAGPRGTGKTSVARILAKAVNCQNAKKSEPCGVCDVCSAVNKGNFLDLVEIDAASNRGIDDVRALREQVNFLPVQGKVKVYVLDEVHMLTKEAFNALLKTLEEPPSHIVFVLCTTEVHRLPMTVISRCQRFDFALGGKEILSNYLHHFGQIESLKIEAEAISLLAEQAQGSYRDAMGLLEKVSTFGKDAVTKDDVISFLGLTLESEASEFLNLLTSGRVEEAVDVIESLSDKGKDLVYFIDLLLLMVKEKLQKRMVEEDKDSLPVGRWLQLAELLQKAMSEMRFATLPQLPLEMVVIRFGLTSEPQNMSNESTQTTEANMAKQKVKEAKSGLKVKSNLSVNSVKKKIFDSDAIWDQVMEQMKPYNHSVHALLKGCRLEKYQNGVVHLGFFYKFHKERIEELKNRRMVEQVFSDVIGNKVQVRCFLREKEIEDKQKERLKAGTKSYYGRVGSEELSEDDLIKITQEILGGEVVDV